MAPLIIPNVYQLVISGTCSGQPVVTVLHFKNTSGVARNLTTDLAAIKTYWEKANGPLKVKPIGFTMTGYKITDLSSETGQVVELASAVAGAGVSVISTMAASALIRLSGGTRDRSGSGRVYHGPLMETQVNADGRTIDTTAATALTTAYNTFKNDMNTIQFQWVVASRKESIGTEVINMTVSSIIATQRRRLR